MERVVAYDITRLFLGPLSSAPRGIDRVDLATARHFFADSKSPNVGVLPTPWGVRTYEAVRVRRGIDHLQELWAELRDPHLDPVWPSLVESLTSGSSAPATPTPRLTLSAKANRMRRKLSATGFAFGRPVRTGLPRGAVYLNVGQIGLAMPMLHNWLENRPDVAAVYMLHDVIPLENPEFVEASSPGHHQRMVRTAARHADGLIVTTSHAHESVTRAISTLRRHSVPTAVRRLPLSEVFAAPRAADPALADCHYFVVCATVEPRKNHALLLAVWRRLAQRLGPATPHLVIAGSAGFNSEEILRPLDEGGWLARRVHHRAGLSSPALGCLMLGAAAVLCPSFAEGFGLPLMEANVLGVPAIASDIAAHREIADLTTVLLDPADDAAWEAAILACAPGGPRRTPPIPPEMTEAAYCRDIAEFLDLCAKRKA